MLSFMDLHVLQKHGLMLSFCGIKYGAALTPRGRVCAFAFIYGRSAIQIDFIISITILLLNAPPLTTNLALVRRFTMKKFNPIMPWSL
jgi:hypothetical protein